MLIAERAFAETGEPLFPSTLNQIPDNIVQQKAAAMAEAWEWKNYLASFFNIISGVCVLASKHHMGSLYFQIGWNMRLGGNVAVIQVQTQV